MRRNEYTHRRRHISNRHLSDKYYYAGEHETATGIRLIDKAPRKGAEGLQIAFLHPKSTWGVLTELCEKP